MIRTLTFTLCLTAVSAHASATPDAPRIEPAPQVHATIRVDTSDDPPAVRALSAGAPAHAAAKTPRPPTPIGEFPPNRKPHRVRALIEIGTYLVFDWSLLLFTPPPQADPPGNVSVWTKLSGKGITFDVSAYNTNFLFHPFAGRLYYGLARSNGLSAWESFGWSWAAASLWELFEFPENFSINDDIVTPVGGTASGEALYQLANWIDGQHYGWPGTLASTLLAPPLRLNTELSGEDSPAGPVGRLSYQMSLAGGVIRSNGAWHPSVGIHLKDRLVQDAAYGQVGRGTRVRTDGGATELAATITAAEGGVADLRISAWTWIDTVYLRDLSRNPSGGLQGYDLLAGVGPGWDYRLHDWDFETSNPRDTFTTVQFPRVFAEVRRFHAPVRFSVRMDAGLSLGGTRSVVLDAIPGAAPFETLPTPVRAYGYYFGWGPSLATSVGLGVGPATLTATAAYDALKGIDARDVWPGRHPTADLNDSWTDLAARFGYRLPWKSLEVSASATRTLRSGHADATDRTVGQTSLVFGLGFAGI